MIVTFVSFTTLPGFMSKIFFYYSKSFPSILNDKNISIVFSTFQAGKIIFLGSQNGRTLNLYAKNFARPMGIAVNKDQIAVSSQNKIDLFTSSPLLAKNYPLKKNYYDTLYIPQATYYTGKTDIHDIAWGTGGLWAVNTAFSTLCLMDNEFHFIPKWKPYFITEITPGDKCHLNGFAMKDGEPEYVTMFDQTDAPEGWRNDDVKSGLLMNVRKQEILLNNLPMPHSPVFNDDNVYFVLSFTGEVMKYDTRKDNLQSLTGLNCFVRGLAISDDLLFVGSSEIRESSKSFPNIRTDKKISSAGIFVIDIKTGKQVAKITFTDYIKEIFSLQIIDGSSNPALINQENELAFNSIYLSKEHNYWTKMPAIEQLNKDQNYESKS